MAGRHLRALPGDNRRRRFGSRLLATVVGFLLSGAMVLTVSQAAFSDTTSNTGNSLSTGTVILTDDAVSALFTVSNMSPGQTETRCITVTYEGSIADPGAVVVYSGGFTDPDGLAGTLTMTIHEGASAATCASFSGTQIFSGTLTSFDTTHTGYGDGAGTWDPSAAPESRPYRIAITLPLSADTILQGKTLSDLVFTWEVQS